MVLELSPWEITAAVALAAYFFGYKVAMWIARRSFQKALTSAQRGVVGLWIEENRRNAKAR
jgi:hypothetical protein